MPTDVQGPDGLWRPAEPLPGSFGLRWEFMWRHRRSIGQGRVRSVVGGWLDVRAVDRLAAHDEEAEMIAMRR